MALMGRYEDNHFDLAIVDPPYGIDFAKTYTNRTVKDKRGERHKSKEWDEGIPTDQYFDELFRVSKEQIIWGGNYYTDFLPATNSWIIWDKKRNADKTFLSEAELAWTSYKKVMRIASYQWDGAKKCERINKWHPHQKPVQLYKWILLNYTVPGSVILDTNLGSGSIAIAVDELNKTLDYQLTLVGCELDSKYYDISCKRITEYTSRQMLEL